MNKGDFFSGLCLAGGAIFIIEKSRALEYHYEHGPGPGFLPFWTGIVLLVLGAMLSIMSFTRAPDKKRGQELDRGKVMHAIGTWVGLILMIALVNKIGFLLSFALFTLLLVVVLDRQSWPRALAVSLGSALGFYLVFVYAFGLRLPVGPWGF